MVNEEKQDVLIVSKNGFQAVGLKWEGTFEEAWAGEIRNVHAEMQQRLQEIAHVTNPEILLGLSYQAKPGRKGFIHYAVVEVEQVAETPTNMINISVPPLTYAQCNHRKGQRIDRSYQHIYAWIERQGYTEADSDLTHVELYPMNQDPYTDEPEFTIMIPVRKK